MKAINLEEILKSYVTPEVLRENKPDYTFNMVLAAMKEACRQTLELAAENAEIAQNINGCRECGAWGVSKQSILKTIKQVEL
jgi:hypothetical protein